LSLIEANAQPTIDPDPSSLTDNWELETQASCATPN